ncbi:hypothetical protein [Alcaligenes faecalis]|uniref:hypothetical protein n=1 Tax=Alcaligenes faecalis TaxID=511 RepID=UPI001293F5C1|nr:hypothetical protein [Alcaligenes faecalis]
MPQSVYRSYRGLLAPGTALRMIQDSRIFNLGKEISQYLLCDDCEGLFSKNGEDYFAKNMLPSKQNPIPEFLNILKICLIPNWNNMFSYSPHYGLTSLGLSGVLVPVNSKAIFYFAISIFWRGGISGWKGYSTIEYDEGLMDKMRSFLLGEGSLSGYFLRVVPSFWREKYGFVLPCIFKGNPFFSIGMCDFYLEKDLRNAFFSLAEAPVLYMADTRRSEDAYRCMSHVISNTDRAKNLQNSGVLATWSKS